MTVQNNNNTTRNHNNKKNKKRNNNMLPSSTTNNKPLRVVTHNVQGLTDPTKQKQLLDTIYLDNINIMGLSETKLNPTASKYFLKTINTTKLILTMIQLHQLVLVSEL